MHTSSPRIVLAALKGGAGKTFITLGLAAALRKNGSRIAVFKKGPDYIDSGWLGFAAGSDCHNLDAYLFSEEKIIDSVIKRADNADMVLIEGNRGLFDGVDARGSYSTAELAKLVKAPVILIIDATKVTRTAAALVLGCVELDPELEIKGVILNRVAGARHDMVLREAIEAATNIPVVGSIKKLPIENFPQRHLGLLPLQEHPKALEFVNEAAQIAAQSIDLEAVIKIAESAGRIYSTSPTNLARTGNAHVTVGVLKDSSFQFYYPENLEALQECGAELMEISALNSDTLPNLDALYIGGGFPETHAELLAANVVFKASVLKAIHEGLPVYAECGGLMYLSRNLLIDGKAYPMVGAFPLNAVLERKPQGHGYIQVSVSTANPFYPIGTVLKGHEFHYSYVTGLDSPGVDYAFNIIRGHGMDGSRDGILINNALGTYLHVHALGEPLWARGIADAATAFRNKSRNNENIVHGMVS